MQQQQREWLPWYGSQFIAHNEINNPLESVTNLVYLAMTAAVDPTALQYLKKAEEELLCVLWPILDKSNPSQAFTQVIPTRLNSLQPKS